MEYFYKVDTSANPQIIKAHLFERFGYLYSIFKVSAVIYKFFRVKTDSNGKIRAALFLDGIKNLPMKNELVFTIRSFVLVINGTFPVKG